MLNYNLFFFKYFKKINFILLFVLGIFLSFTKSYAVFDEIRKGNPDEIISAIEKISKDDINSLFTEINHQEMLKMRAVSFQSKFMYPSGEFKKVTPFHLACLYGNEKAARLLLEKGIDPRAQTTNQWQGFDFFVWSEKDESDKFPELFEKYGISINPFKSYVKLDIIIPENISSSDHSFDSELNTPNQKEVDLLSVDKFIQAAKDGNTSFVKDSMSKKTHLKDLNGSALYWAIVNLKEDIVKLLLDDNEVKVLPKHYFASGISAYDHISEMTISFGFYSLIRIHDLKLNLHSAELPNMELCDLIKDASFKETQDFLESNKTQILPYHYWLAGLVKYKKDFNESKKFYELLKKQSEKLKK